MSVRDAVIVSTARTPIGRAYKGAFNATPGATLGALSLAPAIERAGIDAGEIDDVVWQLLTSGPGDTFHSAAAVAADLRSLSAILDTRASRVEPPKREAVRRGTSSRRGLILVLLAVLLAVGLIWLAARP